MLLEMIEGEKCRKNRCYGLFLVLMEKIPVGDVFKKIICALVDFNYIYGRHYQKYLIGEYVLILRACFCIND